jgi:Pyoverdine/dityrosine biosynthesis protein
MNTLNLLPPQQLHSRVREVLRGHWKSARVETSPAPLPAERVEEMARAALDTMLTRQFRVGPLPPPEVYDQLLLRVRRRVRRNQPIKVTVGYGPLKNQHAVSYSRADWAEFFALCHLVAWHNKVQAVYPPGLKIQIVFDDSTLIMANRVDPELMRSYMTSVAELIRSLGYEQVFLRPFKQSRFSWLFYFGPYLVARWRVRRWEQNPANKEQMARMLEFARRNVVVPAGLDALARDRYLQEASHRYRIYWEALQFLGVSRQRHRLVAMYLDGTQHHIRQEVALHLTTLDKGQMTQPWQGEGVLLDNGHGRLEPFVLTAGRRQRHEVRNVDGLDILPMTGFDRIAVAWLTPAAKPAEALVTTGSNVAQGAALTLKKVLP